MHDDESRIEARLLDLEAQLENEKSRTAAWEAHELMRAEHTVLSLDDRLEASAGRYIRVTMRSGVVHEGVLTRSGRGWVELELQDAPGYLALIATAHVGWVRGLSRKSRHEDERRPRLSLAATLGSEAVARSVIALTVNGRELAGRITRVFRDYLDLATLEAGGEEDFFSVPLGAIEYVRRKH